MSKIIEIIVSAKGETTVTTKGFAGELPRCQSLHRAGPRPADRRAAHGRVPSGDNRRTIAATAFVTSAVSTIRNRSICWSRNFWRKSAREGGIVKKHRCDG